MKNLFEHFKNILKTRNMNQIIKHFMLFVITVLFTFNLYAQQTTKPNLFKYTPLKQTKWSMYSLYKVHVQDFGVTEKYNDTCNCLEVFLVYFLFVFIISCNSVTGKSIGICWMSPSILV